MDKLRKQKEISVGLALKQRRGRRKFATESVDSYIKRGGKITKLETIGRAIPFDGPVESFSFNSVGRVLGRKGRS